MAIIGEPLFANMTSDAIIKSEKVLRVHSKGTVWKIFQALFLSVVLFVFLYGLSTLFFGDAQSGVKYLQGYHCYLIESKIDIGEVSPGDSKEVLFTVRNLSRDGVKIIGAGSSCSCIATGGLPEVIPPLGVGTLTVTFHAVDSSDGEVDQFVQEVEFYTNIPQHPPLPATIVGRIGLKEEIEVIDLSAGTDSDSSS